jgi:hypothetical protein
MYKYSSLLYFSMIHKSWFVVPLPHVQIQQYLFFSTICSFHNPRLVEPFTKAVQIFYPPCLMHKSGASLIHPQKWCKFFILLVHLQIRQLVNPPFTKAVESFYPPCLMHKSSASLIHPQKQSKFFILLVDLQIRRLVNPPLTNAVQLFYPLCLMHKSGSSLIHPQKRCKILILLVDLQN